MAYNRRIRVAKRRKAGENARMGRRRRPKRWAVVRTVSPERSAWMTGCHRAKKSHPRMQPSIR